MARAQAEARRNRPDPASGWTAVLATAGLFADRDQPEYLWPGNEPAWALWLAVQTQWRVGMAGPTGLDYAGIGRHLDEIGIEPGADRRELWEALLAAERACLDVWAEPAATA